MRHDVTIQALLSLRTAICATTSAAVGMLIGPAANPSVRIRLPRAVARRLAAGIVSGYVRDFCTALQTSRQREAAQLLARHSHLLGDKSTVEFAPGQPYRRTGHLQTVRKRQTVSQPRITK
jgi:hypothetical protein